MRYNEISKITDFHPPHLHLAPPLAVTFEFLQDALHQKTRIPRLMYMYIFLLRHCFLLAEGLK